MTDVIATRRTILRPFRLTETDELHELFGDPATHTIGNGPLTSPAQTRRWIRRRIETRGRSGLLWYSVRDRDTDLLGNCGLFAGRTGTEEPEIGYEIRRSHQGRGFATEVADAVLQEAMFCGTPRVWATIRPHNSASLRVATIIGLLPQCVRTDAEGPLVYLASPLGTGRPDTVAP
ncbi:GNAT family N-acetyltransferase [Nocardia sp. NPDC050799]|uniref:GNAT family N-acetyltransferase n=1 Tax=Nocardia sp. NPDC050799 TaxID=3154842 RepID=UPI0033DC0942